MTYCKGLYNNKVLLAFRSRHCIQTFIYTDMCKYTLVIDYEQSLFIFAVRRAWSNHIMKTAFNSRIRVDSTEKGGKTWEPCSLIAESPYFETVLN